MKFRDFFEFIQPGQISRKEFYEVLRWVTALSAAIGLNARDSTFQGDFALKYQGADPQRTIRILKWGAQQLRSVSNQFPHPEEILKGTQDQQIVPAIRQLKSIVASLDHNFSQVGFDSSQFGALPGLKKQLEKYGWV